MSCFLFLYSHQATPIIFINWVRLNVDSGIDRVWKYFSFATLSKREREIERAQRFAESVSRKAGLRILHNERLLQPRPETGFFDTVTDSWRLNFSEQNRGPTRIDKAVRVSNEREKEKRNGCRNFRDADNLENPLPRELPDVIGYCKYFRDVSKAHSLDETAMCRRKSGKMSKKSKNGIFSWRESVLKLIHFCPVLSLCAYMYGYDIIIIFLYIYI